MGGIGLGAESCLLFFLLLKFGVLRFDLRKPGGGDGKME